MLYYKLATNLFFKALDILATVGECVQQLEPERRVLGRVVREGLAQETEQDAAHDQQLRAAALGDGAQELQLRMPHLC